MTDLLLISEEKLEAAVERAVRRLVPVMDDEALTLTEAAAVLKMSTKTLRRKLARGEIRKLPGHPIRILRSQLGGT